MTRGEAGAGTESMPGSAPRCWCGNEELVEFSPEYVRCTACETLLPREMPRADVTDVGADEGGLYGKDYWFGHQEQDLGIPDITRRAREDLPERCLHWLRAALKYRLPPAKTLEVGAAHGGFVAVLRLAGFDAAGLELSPWVAEYAKRTFGVPMLRGAMERQHLPAGGFDLVVMMDVIEHLPDPAGTLRSCVELLAPGGVLLVQTPEYPEGQTFEQLRDAGSLFVRHLQPREHLHLFSQRAAVELMKRAGVPHVAFEPAMFPQHDQFFVASRAVAAPHSVEQVRAALEATPGGRMAGALLDLAENRDYYRRECVARLKVIEVLDAEVKRLRGQEGAAAA